MSETALVSDSASDGEKGKNYAYLSLLARSKKALESAVEVAVPVTDIRPYPDQPRQYFNPAAIQNLSYSIDGGGQTTAGIIRKNPGSTPYELIDGERRWRAIKLIPEERRPLYRGRLIEAEDDVVQFLISGVANFNREDHTPIEAMRTITRLVKYLPMKEIADLLGKSEGWTQNMYSLRKLEPNVLALLDHQLPKEKRLPVTAAVEISRIEARLQMGLALRVLKKEIPLTRLRGEVVKTATRAGSPIKIRIPEVTPLDQWNSITKKVAMLLQTVEDLGPLFEVKEMHAFLDYRADETRALQTKLRKVREGVEKAEEAIRNVQTRSKTEKK